MDKKVLILKGLLFGIIGAIAGQIPNAIIKFFLFFSGALEFCFRNINNHNIWQGDGLLTPCGFTWVTYPIIKLFLSPVVLIGGALAGFLFMFWGYKVAHKKGKAMGPGGWKGSFWWSFLGGFVFDLAFLIPIIYPGQ